MENQRLRDSRREKPKSRSRRQDAGFALITLISALPVLFAVIAVLATGFNALRRKSLAQALCLQNGMQLQLALKVPLKKLLHLNPQAERLRSARFKADRALEAAESSLYPPAIAAAQAVQTAVIVAQASLRAQQELLLVQAEFLRANGNREFGRKILPLASSPLRSQRYYSRALAVQPKPADSPSPNYEPIPAFSTGQQQEFSFDVNVLAGVPYLDLKSAKQKTQCSVSLEEKDGEWKLRIVAAKARSS